MRLDREDLQPAVNRGLGDPSCYSQSPSAPVGTAIGWLGLQCPIDHIGHLVVLVSAGPTRVELVVQTLQAELSVTIAPLSDGHPGQVHPLGNGGVGFTGPTSQDDLGSLQDRMRQ